MTSDEYYNDERPDSWPNRLRAVAHWLEITDRIVAAAMKTQPDHPLLSEALACIEGGDMQADLRMLADILEEFTDSVVQE